MTEQVFKCQCNSQGRSQGPDFEGASSFKGCRATSPPEKFKILYRVSEIPKNRGSPILELWARRIYETIKLIENRNDFFSNFLFALDHRHPNARYLIAYIII